MPGEEYRSDSRQKQRESLKLKGGSAQTEIAYNEHAPVDSRHDSEDDKRRKRIFAVVPVNRLDGHEEVEKRDHEHELPRLDRRFARWIFEEPARTQFLVVLIAAQKLEIGIADADDIVDINLSSVLGAPAVDEGTVQTLGIVYEPALVAPQKHGVNPRYGGVLNDDIVGLLSAD